LSYDWAVVISKAAGQKWIIGLWFLLLASQVIREYNGMAAGTIQPDTRPFPRPCVLLGGAAAFTVLGVMAEFLPTIAALTGAGLTLGVLMAPAAKGQQTPIGLFDQVVQKLNGMAGGG
jgi:hypothetical protein